MRLNRLRHEFVDEVPRSLDEGVLYVSIEYGTAIHLCCCGCRSEVVTPLTPTDWRITYDGETVSLEPSIGNWGFDCRSHYWIANDRVRWACDLSEAEVEEGRRWDRRNKQRYFGESEPDSSLYMSRGESPREARGVSGPFWRSLMRSWGD